MDKYKDEKILARIVSINTTLNEKFDPFYKEVEENFTLIQGQIYNENDLKKLRLEKRPTFQTNLFRPILNQLGGNFKSNMPGLDFLGRTQDDHQKTKLISSVNDYIMYSANDMAYELSKAYLFASIGRIGWLKQDFSYENDPKGVVEIKHYSSELKYDASTTRRDLEDCQYMVDQAYLTTDDIIRIYAQSNPELAEMIDEEQKKFFGDDKTTRNKWMEKLAEMASSFFNSASQKMDGDLVENEGRLLILDWYERRQEKKMTIYNRLDGQSHDITAKVKIEGKEGETNWYDNNKLQAIKKKMLDPFIEEGYIQKIYQTSVCPALNLKLWDEPQQLQNGNFKFTPVVAYDYSEKLIDTKCVIDDVKDAVRSYNLRDNTNLTYLLKSAHGGVYVEVGVDEKGLGDLKSNQIGGITKVPTGAISRNLIKEKGVPRIDNAVLQHMEQKNTEIDKVSGITPNSRGLKENSGESGKLFQSRVIQADIMQEWVNENAQSSLKLLASNNIFFIQNQMTEERVIRVLKDGKPEWYDINKQTLEGVMNDVTVGEFDVTIAIKPFGKGAKEIERNRLLELAELLSNFGEKFLPSLEKVVIEIIKNTPIASQDEIVQLLEGNGKGDMQQQLLQQQQAMQAEQQLNAGERQAKTKETEAKTVKILEEAKKIARDADSEEAHRTLDNMLNELQIGVKPDYEVV